MIIPQKWIIKEQHKSKGHNIHLAFWEGRIFGEVLFLFLCQAICFSDKQSQWALYWNTHCYLDPESLFLLGNGHTIIFSVLSSMHPFCFGQERGQDRDPSIWASSVKTFSGVAASQEPFVTASMYKKWKISASILCTFTFRSLTWGHALDLKLSAVWN